MIGNGFGGGQTCPQCGSNLYPGDVFCTNCGFSVGNPAGEFMGEPAAVDTCPVCGGQIFEGDVFCTSCGADISGGLSANNAQPSGQYGQAAYSTSMTGAASGMTGAYGTSQQIAVPIDDDDHPTARPKLVRLTRAEARGGCHKVIEVDGQTIDVDIPAGVDMHTKLDVPGLGYFDEQTGMRGPLRLSFHVVD